LYLLYDKVKTVFETVISQLHSVFTAVFQKLCWLTDSNCWNGGLSHFWLASQKLSADFVMMPVLSVGSMNFKRRNFQNNARFCIALSDYGFFMLEKLSVQYC